MAALAPLIVPAVKRHTATVIFAHGLGDSGAGWIPIAQNWRRLSKFEDVKFIFPNAPSIPITVNFGQSMPGWYDIVRDRGETGFDDLQAAHDDVGILKSSDYFHSLIQAEKDKGIPTSRIVLGGFSQGGAMSLFAGITCTEKLGGIVGLSSYLLIQDKIQALLPKDNPNKATPIFMGHGDQDPLVKYTWGQLTAKALRGFGFKVDFRTYRGLAHSADPDEIDDLEKFLIERLPAQGNIAQVGASSKA